MRTNEQGRSMIEMLGVLAIIGVLSIGGIAGYSKAMQKFKTNKVIDQVSIIVANLRTLYAQQTTYNGLNTETAIMMGVIPDELATGGDKIEGRNPFKGDVSIGAAKLDQDKQYDPSEEGAFYIAFTKLPKDACVNIVTGDWGGGYSSGLVGIAATSISGTSNPFNKAEGADTAEINGAAFTQNMGVPCPGGTGTTIKGVACPNGATEPTPFNVAKAARACACTNNSPTCAVIWKYF